MGKSFFFFWIYYFEASRVQVTLLAFRIEFRRCSISWIDSTVELKWCMGLCIMSSFRTWASGCPTLLLETQVLKNFINKIIYSSYRSLYRNYWNENLKKIYFKEIILKGSNNFNIKLHLFQCGIIFTLFFHNLTLSFNTLITE